MDFRSWLGGLDSNQDSQLQRLMYCRLYDLPAEEGRVAALVLGRLRNAQDTLFGKVADVNRAGSLEKSL
jgi:hypothetical protein